MTNQVGPIALVFSFIALIIMLGETVYAVSHYLLH
jgi:hypothetical protein